MPGVGHSFMYVSCRISTDSHTLTDSAFRVLKLPSSTIRVGDVSDNGFVLHVQKVEENTSQQTKILMAHHVIRAFVVSINVASFGMFYWTDEPWVHPVFQISESPESPPHSSHALIAQSKDTCPSVVPLTDIDVQNSILIFGILVREPIPTFETEYAKGLLLLRMNFCDIDFRREAFLCFYRGLENFVVTRILRVNKLRNELRDLQRALAQVGASPEAIDELRELYTTRSSQVAHAQVSPRELSFEEVMKAKLFLDFAMHKTFKAQGVKLMEAQPAMTGRKPRRGVPPND